MSRCLDLFIDRAETDGAAAGLVGAGATGAEEGLVGAGVTVGAAQPAVALASLADLADELTAVTGLRLTEDPATGRWAATTEGARVELAEVDATREHRLVVSPYRYHLFARVQPADALTSPEAHLLRRVLCLVKADGRFRAMLVWDLPRVVEHAATG